jgi:hypothetical protein
VRGFAAFFEVVAVLVWFWFGSLSKKKYSIVSSKAQAIERFLKVHAVCMNHFPIFKDYT